jgi:two-component system cell cycle response regulator
MAPKSLILIVDDELFFREILQDALSGDYDIIEGKNGDEAISLALAHKPSLIIMDVEMPGRSGVDACKVLKDMDETAAIPLILLSARSRKDDLILGLQAGADDYFTKPMSIPEVTARVDAHLRTSDYYSELEHKDLLFLLELSENIAAIRNPMTILRLIVKKMAEIVDLTRCSIISINDRGEACVKASNDLKRNDEIKLELSRYPEISKSFESKQTIIVNDVKHDPLMDSVRQYIHELDYNSIVVIPIIKKESVIGTFFLRTSSPLKDGITLRVRKLCQLVANISANALENAILFESMKTAQEYFEEMAIRDGLTKLYNHRYFYNRLEEEFSRASRYGTPLSLVFFDIDNFKRVNDTFGHTNGDKVLAQIGSFMKKVARESDIAARYGGEEFALLLPNTPAAGALDVGTRLCTIIREHQFADLDGGKISISAGVSTYAADNLQAFEQLVKLADEAMYTAKKQGKDRILQA